MPFAHQEKVAELSVEKVSIASPTFLEYGVSWGHVKQDPPFHSVMDRAWVPSFEKSGW